MEPDRHRFPRAAPLLRHAVDPWRGEREDGSDGAGARYADHHSEHVRGGVAGGDRSDAEPGRRGPIWRSAGGGQVMSPLVPYLFPRPWVAAASQVNGLRYFGSHTSAGSKSPGFPTSRATAEARELRKRLPSASGVFRRYSRSVVPDLFPVIKRLSSIRSRPAVEQRHRADLGRIVNPSRKLQRFESSTRHQVRCRPLTSRNVGWGPLRSVPPSLAVANCRSAVGGVSGGCACCTQATRLVGQFVVSQGPELISRRKRLTVGCLRSGGQPPKAPIS